MAASTLLLSGALLAALLAILVAARAIVAARRSTAGQISLRDRIRALPPPPIRTVKEPVLKLPRRTPADQPPKSGPFR